MARVRNNKAVKSSSRASHGPICRTLATVRERCWDWSDVALPFNRRNGGLALGLTAHRAGCRARGFGSGPLRLSHHFRRGSNSSRRRLHARSAAWT